MIPITIDHGMGTKGSMATLTTATGRINKYRHPARGSKEQHQVRVHHQLKAEQEIMGTLRKMIEYLKGKSDREVESIKHMPKYNPRGVT